MGSCCGKPLQDGADGDKDSEESESSAPLLDHTQEQQIIGAITISPTQPEPIQSQVVSEAPVNETNTKSTEDEEEKRQAKKKELRQLIQRKMIVAWEKNRVLQAQKAVDTNQGPLQALLQNFQISHRHQVPPAGKTYELEPADDNTWSFVMRKFNNHRFKQNYVITDICRIWNPYLLVQYTMKKIEYGDKLTEQYLFHGTEIQGARGVCADNFDWRKVQNTKFGRGVSFANNPWFASHYSIRRHRGNADYVMILAKVLIEEGQLSIGDSKTLVPITGHTTTNNDGQVLVKYDDASFYPEFIVYFREKTFHHMRVPNYYPPIWLQPSHY